jgi:hypothetical protein
MIDDANGAPGIGIRQQSLQCAACNAARLLRRFNLRLSPPALLGSYWRFRSGTNPHATAANPISGTRKVAAAA